MNTLVIVLIAAVLLCCAYVFYGRWIANKWGIDPKAETPAKKFADGKDYVPTDGWTVFSHQFSSIAGAGPVTGAIQAAVFGWLPVLLWVLIRSPIDFPSFFTLAYKAPKSVTAPKKMPPISTHSKTGSHPNTAA